MGWAGEREKSSLNQQLKCAPYIFEGHPVYKDQTPLENAFFLLLIFGNQMVSCLLPLSLQTERELLHGRRGEEESGGGRTCSLQEVLFPGTACSSSLTLTDTVDDLP